MIDAKALEAAARGLARTDLAGEAYYDQFTPAKQRQVTDAAQACITAYLAAEGERGFVMVPVEPTPEMHDVGCDKMLDPIGLSDAYRAMIAASQSDD